MQQELRKIILMHKTTLAYIVIKEYGSAIQVTMKQQQEPKEHIQTFKVNEEFFNIEKMSRFYSKSGYKIMLSENFDTEELKKKDKLKQWYDV
jgi:hypothetical protein